MKTETKHRVPSHSTYQQREQNQPARAGPHLQLLRRPIAPHTIIRPPSHHVRPRTPTAGRRYLAFSQPPPPPPPRRHPIVETGRGATGAPLAADGRTNAGIPRRRRCNLPIVTWEKVADWSRRRRCVLSTQVSSCDLVGKCSPLVNTWRTRRNIV